MAASVALAGSVPAGGAPAEGNAPNAAPRGLRLLGMDDLQARSAYQPTIHHHADSDRFIAYVGHHGGSALNPLTGQEEPNGVSIVDVTNPRNPDYLAHIPGPAPGGGAQMVRTCNGSDLPEGDPDTVYLLRAFGNEAHEIWDVTDPANPSLLTTVVDGLEGTHKSFWECETGIAYLVSGVPGWRTNRMTQIFDLSDPAEPVHIRDYGLVGQEPGSTVQPVPTSLHGPISLGDRVYFGHGTGSNGIMQIVDRDELLNGPTEPTPENLQAPEISLLRLSSLGGAHTTFPVLDVPVREHADFGRGATRDLVVIVNESTSNECRTEAHQVMYMADITDETTPQIISNYQVPESEGNYCSRGGRFGAHSSNENMTPIYYRKIVFISYFNAGVRAVDIRDPFNPVEVGRYVPATTENTDPRCVEVDGEERCKTAIQTNNVEVDDRGFVYIVDRANTGMHVLQPTGQVANIAGL
ncbi:MAG: hypothetical protein GEU93_06210 [Propionibacteriales bacterium]|nr:hypothetical protein [Propionibacteriales bacterium]